MPQRSKRLEAHDCLPLTSVRKSQSWFLKEKQHQSSQVQNMPQRSKRLEARGCLPLTSVRKSQSRFLKSDIKLPAYRMCRSDQNSRKHMAFSSYFYNKKRRQQTIQVSRASLSDFVHLLAYTVRNNAGTEPCWCRNPISFGRCVPHSPASGTIRDFFLRCPDVSSKPLPLPHR